jgi:TonB family protein
VVQPIVRREDPARHVDTDVFGNVAGVNLKSAASTVRLAAFGDSYKVVPVKDGAGRGLVPVGAFDAQTEVGSGHSPRGVVAVKGFENGRAADSTRGRNRVEQTEFSAAAIVPVQVKRSLSAEESEIIPVSIQNKPLPVYTNEARQLKVEGEVLVSVVFGSDGVVRVVAVVKGLGHGLDEAAVEAARRIRFVPAQRYGKRVDCSAVLHIVFALP